MKKYKLLICFLCVFLFSLFAVNVVFAEEINDDVSKSLTIHFYVQKTGVDTPISGAKFGIAKVADYKDGRYEVAAKYSDDIDLDLNHAEDSDFVSLSKKLTLKNAQYGVTDQNGNIRFDIVDEGLYFVVEESATDDALNYQLAESYIVAVPFYYDGVWEYNVVSNPKTTMIVRDEPSPGVPIVTSNPTSAPVSVPVTVTEITPGKSSPVITGSDLVRSAFCLSIIVIMSSLLMVLCGKRGDKD